ncbi:type II toxin-antitoxin system VapC family toxin [Runella sp. SP2]|uniref:type II toxin-antitoxin system VapC family toxin n=1 Tax=Runella sp. SP2 TaxID=2268026 RepID=UPI001E5D86C5|nr:type II toxin-antitoxin system VapC family toxin [Runella sp. SP2]
MLDTSIFIEYLRASNKTRTALYKLADTPLSLSSVTYYELLMGATNELKKRDVYLLTQQLTILPFNDAVAEKASEIFHALK